MLMIFTLLDSLVIISTKSRSSRLYTIIVMKVVRVRWDIPGFVMSSQWQGSVTVDWAYEYASVPAAGGIVMEPLSSK